METRSRGFHHWTNYEVEGDAARIIGHFEREQTQAAIAPQTEFAMRFYGHGRGIKIGVRHCAPGAEPPDGKRDNPNLRTRSRDRSCNRGSPVG